MRRVQTYHLFLPLQQELISLLRGLGESDWSRPTLARRWAVKDIAAHLLDTDLRRLSSQRDGYGPGPPTQSADDYKDLVAFLNRLNASWVEATKRLSPRVLVDLLEWSGPRVAELFASLPPDGPSHFSVAWAGEERSANWMDTGREYTEWWHHQMQIRDAVGAPPLLVARWLAPLLDFSVRALPRAYASLDAPEGTTVAIYVDGEPWTVRREGGRWDLYEGAPERPTTKVRLDADTAWRIFYNALRGRAGVVIEGDPLLAEPLLRTRSVMV